MDKKLLNKSINNLLNNCAELNENDTLLIISEDSKFGWYDKDISIAVYDYAKNKLGLSTELLIVGEPKNNAKILLKKSLIITIAPYSLQELVIKKDLKSRHLIQNVLCLMLEILIHFAPCLHLQIMKKCRDLRML